MKFLAKVIFLSCLAAVLIMPLTACDTGNNGPEPEPGPPPEYGPVLSGANIDFGTLNADLTQAEIRHC